MIIMMASSMTGLVAVAMIHQNRYLVPGSQTDLEPLLLPLLAVCTEAFQRSPCRVLGNRCVQSMPFKVMDQTLANGSSSYMLVNC